MLKEQEEVEWTLFNMGWLADYFLPEGASYMPPIKDEFPVDVDGWKACVRGSGDEAQSWTCARDVARAVVELCRADKWVFMPRLLSPLAFSPPPLPPISFS